jgi:4-diphosphocytidyl-2-C-methyl-D-erythritol kinase
LAELQKSELVTERAFAKINLNLHVTGRRYDGFHMLESLVAFTDISDVLTFSASDHLSLTLSGPFAANLEEAGANLVLTAARALSGGCSELPTGAKIHLEKNLPLASGIGGGSADAAATLRGLVALHKAPISPTALVQIAASLGSDVPACLLSQAAFISGTGTIVEPLKASLPELYVALVNPNIHLATSDVFKALGLAPGSADHITAPIASPKPFSSTHDLLAYLKETQNDLEPLAAQLVREIDDVIEALFAQNACLLARMTGSGATCFGLFESLDDAANAAQNIRAAMPGWWAAQGKLM